MSRTSEPLNCPHCGVSLLDKEIPEEDRKYYGGATHFKREILVEVWGVYDGGLYYRCPDCGKPWHRWPEKFADMRALAEKYWNRPDTDNIADAEDMEPL